MIPARFDYVAPDTIDAAVKHLASVRNARVLAGGLSLVTAMKLGRAAPALVVDLRNISGLRGVGGDGTGGGLQIGAMATHAEIAAAAVVKQHYPALADAANAIGDPQVRNRGTIGGSLSYNDPAADWPAVALALAAVLKTVGPDGHRAIPADQFVAGAFRTSLGPGDIVTSVDVPAAGAASGSAYEKFANPASGYAICGVAAMIEQAADGTVKRCRVALTGAADHAVRLHGVEAAVEGKPSTAETLTAAARRVAAEGLSFVSDLAASAEYRAHLAEVLTERALTRAGQRAGAQ